VTVTATVIVIAIVTGTGTAIVTGTGGPGIAIAALSDSAAANPTVLALPVSAQTATGGHRLRQTHTFLAPQDLEADLLPPIAVVHVPAAPVATDTEMTTDTHPKMTDTGSGIATMTGFVPRHVVLTHREMTTEESLVLARL
jgi:hypothetical protein